MFFQMYNDTPNNSLGLYTYRGVEILQISTESTPLDNIRELIVMFSINANKTPFSWIGENLCQNLISAGQTHTQSQ